MAIIEQLVIILILIKSYSLGLGWFGINKTNTQETLLQCPFCRILIGLLIFVNYFCFLHLQNSKGYEIVVWDRDQFLLFNNAS